MNTLFRSLLAGAGLLALSCTTVPPYERPFQATRIEAPADHIAVDQVVVLFDASGSIDPQSEFPYEKARLESFVDGMPDGSYDVDLVAFGGVHRDSTGLDRFDRSRLEAAAREVDFVGEDTPLADVLHDTAEKLAGRSGTAAVVIVTDGVPTRLGTQVDVEPTLLAAKEVVERHDGKVCFHTVHAGEESEGSELLVEISQLTDCGSYRSSDSIDSAAPLYAFQRDVFLAGAPVDVAAPPPVRVSDADGDGVPDGSDACVDTPAGARVDSRGCWDLTRVGFASDSAAVDPNLVPEITALAGVLKANPDLSVRIEGHTDATGSEAYNQALSVRRADAVRASLEEAGVAADRIQVAGLGETQPVASNATAAGRAENRRIEFLIQR